jgi:carbon storage regulator
LEIVGRRPFIAIVLIVARRKGQRIRIGENIEVVVTEISRGEVRLGIVAPKEVLVVREEIRRAVEEANRAAAGSSIALNDNVGEPVVVGELPDVGAISSSPRTGTRS